MSSDLEAMDKCKKKLYVKRHGEHFTITEKIEIIKLLNQGIKQIVLVKELGISKFALSRIWKNRQNLSELNQSINASPNRDQALASTPVLEPLQAAIEDEITNIPQSLNGSEK